MQMKFYNTIICEKKARHVRLLKKGKSAAATERLRVKEGRIQLWLTSD